MVLGMAAIDFDKCMVRVLAYEGGYSNHPADPGGVTLEGVIQRVYDAYRQRKGLQQQALTPQMRGTPQWTAERNEIYRIQYWDKIRGDELPAGVDIVVFDAAVNSGPVQAVKWLQRALRLNQVDGAFGEATMAALENVPDNDLLVADICARRLAFMQALKTWTTFGKGWNARVVNLKAVGQVWATGSVGPAPVAVANDGGSAKANEVSLPQAPVRPGYGASGTTAGVVTSGIVDQVQGALAPLAPMQDTITVAKYIVLAGTLAVAAITLFGIYRNWKAARAINGEDTATVAAEGAY